MQAQQLQFQAQLIEVQKQAQIEADRKMEENFEKLITMLADKTPEKVTNNRTSRGEMQRKR